ncbi:MAG: ABC transporter permease [Eubacteriales bacterium]|nr:ABC transporter permease [Eubacteriales bacterium]
MENSGTMVMDKRKRRLKAMLLSNFSFIGLLLVVVLFELMTDGKLLGSRNLMNIFNNFFSIGLSAMGFAFIMALGELDLSVGAIVGFSAAMGAFAARISLWLVLPAALMTGLLIGSLNGVAIAHLKVESFIGTLAMSFVVRGLTTWFLNGSVGVPIAMRAFDANGVKIATFAVLLVVLYILYEHCAYGKHCRAVGASKPAALQSGVKVKRTRMTAFMISGVMCGLVGFFTLVRACTASSSTGNSFEFDVLLAVLFGGMPLSGGWPVRFRSAVIGSIAMAVLKSGMSLAGINGLTQQIIEGVILIAVVALSFDRKNVAVIQ